MRTGMLVCRGVIFCALFQAAFGRAAGAQLASESTSTAASRPTARGAESPLERVIALDLRNTRLEDALTEINRRAGLGLSYTPLVVPLDRRVTVQAKRITARAALERVLSGTGVRLKETSSGTVLLVKADDVVKTSAATGAITGHVTDTAGRSLAGAEVLLEHTRWRATTDSAGRYRFAEVDVGTYTLIVRRLGYGKHSRRVTVHAEREDTVDVVLSAAAITLNDLVTTATGQQRRRDIGNAITTIVADSVLRTAPIRNLTDLLENRVPGLTVQHTSGAPGDPARLRLRGLRSIRQSNDPVIVVDGVRIYAAQSAPRSGNLTNLGGRSADGNVVNDATGQPLIAGNTPAPSPLDQIDPNIIDKIEIFKGPSAATLYGPDAANGVIVITTKRGKPGPTRWSARFQQGFTDTPGQWPEGYYRFGHNPVYGGIGMLCPLSATDCTQDSLVRFQALNQSELTILGKGRRTSASLGASGGTQALTYSITGTYGDELGLLTLPSFEVERFRERFNRAPPDWMERPHHYQDWSVTSNVMARLSPSADVTITTALSRSDQQRSTLENKIATLAGTYVDRVYDFYYTPGPINYGCPTCLNYQLAKNDEYVNEYYKRTTASSITFTTTLAASWRPATWFAANGNAGLNVAPREDEVLLPPGLLTTNDSGAIVRGTGRSLVSTLNVGGNLRKPLWHGFVFETSLGANLTSTTVSDLVSTAQGLVLGTSTITGAQRISAMENRDNSSVFGWYIEPRITGQRLSLSTGIRLDGGTAYGARITGVGAGASGGFLRGLLALPKLNGSWVVSEEPWFPFRGFFSSLRLRGAYGQAQTQPGTTDRLRLYTRSLAELGEQLALTNVGNTHLRPERSIEFEGGFDADLLDSRVSVELTGYHTTQVDALQPVTLPGSINGGGSTMMNIGNIRNRGLELKLGLTPLRSPSATWTTQLLYSSNSNTLVKLGRGVIPSPTIGLVEGYPLFARWARPIIGYADQNGDGVLQRDEVRVGDSLVFMGRLQPAYQTALQTTATLFGGAITLSAGFTYDAGATQVNSTARTNWVLARSLVDPSTPLIEQAAVLAFDSTDYGLTQDVSTFRFQTFSMGYRAPARVARWVGAQQLSVALQGSNLGLHSTYHGKDPNVSAWSPTESVVDNGQLPLPRTWQLAFFLDF